MHLSSLTVRNFRRLKLVTIDLAKETTTFVGSNNSGKTSAGHIFHLFLNENAKFTVHDFSADCWDAFNRFDPARAEASEPLPSISLDLWFTVDEENLHRVIDILPDLEWEGKTVGVRIAFEPLDEVTLWSNYRKEFDVRLGQKNVDDTSSVKKEFADEPQGSDEFQTGGRLSQDSSTLAMTQSFPLVQDDREPSPPAQQSKESYQAWPSNLYDYISKRLNQEYRIRYYKLDHSKPEADYLPTLLDAGAKILASLIRVDFLDAQRYLSDVEARGRSEDLSRRMSRFYQRNLKKPDPDFKALSALAQSEASLNAHFANVFESTLASLRKLGYPGVTNPELIIKTELKADALLSSSAQVHYAVAGTSPELSAEVGLTLPDRYNGLGFKNLIYMVVEILDYHQAWLESKESRPPVHVVVIEEPESHLHAQLQQVFVRQVREIVGEAVDGLGTQFIITTHSSHVVYEDFRSIRYFRRVDEKAGFHFTEVKNLSNFYEGEKETRDFLLQYLKLTHCDLFFADAAVLVEGNVERLLLPLIIAKSRAELETCHLSILEVSGAYAHKFRELIEFLGLTTLVITDLDSVVASNTDQHTGSDEESGTDEEDSPKKGKPKSCLASAPGAITSNPILKSWVPGLVGVVDLLGLDSSKKVSEYGGSAKSAVRVAYQTLRPATWKGLTTSVAGRTFEEAFAFENLEWSQSADNKALGLGLKNKVLEGGLDAIFEGIYEKMRGIDKTQFALALISSDLNAWESPHYIVEGLDWLAGQLGVFASSESKSD